MLALQASIGAVNDIVDAPLDRGHKPGKPIPRGAVRLAEARGVAAVGLLLGLALSGLSGLPTAAVAALGVGLGYLYDARLSRTAWSWLPLAGALPLVPIHAWLGATGQVPAALLTLLPIGILAGGGLALANGIADLERDASAGVRTAAVRLGRWAWVVDAAAMAGAIGLAWLVAPGSGRVGGTTGGGLAGPIGMAVGSLVVVLGLGLAAARSANLRERGWELQAAGTALLGLAWIGRIGVF